MVDFNNEATIGTPAVDVQRITLLQRRYDLFEALEDHKKKADSGINLPFTIVKARLLTFFLELDPMLRRHWHSDKNSTEESKKKYALIKSICLGRNEEDIDEEQIINVLLTLNRFLDDPLRITRLDTKQVYDPRDMEGENEIKGY